jgi:branched-chain amino acid transport system permease protein
VGSLVGRISYVLVDNSALAISLWVNNDLGRPFDLSAYTIFDVLILIMYLMPTGIVG